MGEKDIEKEEVESKKDLAEFSHVYVIKLLFEKKVDIPKLEVIKEALIKTFEDVEIVSDVEGLFSFSINKYVVHYKDDKELPVQVLIASCADFDKRTIGDFEKSQVWDIKNLNDIIEKCNYTVMISDFLAAGLDYKKRCYMITKWTETVLSLISGCVAVYYESSGKLLTSKHVMENPYAEDLKFLYGGVNVRFFNVQGTKDMIVDTLGMYSVGLPDIQYHFHDLDINKVVNHAYNLIAYIFDKGAVIKSGDIIESFLPDTKWTCRYEKSLIKPFREVLDINTCEYASGSR